MTNTAGFAPNLLKGTHVFITGGSSGINLGIAKSFAEAGASVGMCARDPEKLLQARHELESLGAKVSTTVADVRDYDAVHNAISVAHAQLGPINTLVCGAAGNFLCPAEELSSNGFKAVVDIDLNGSFHASKAAFDDLKSTSGNIIFVSAGQSFVPHYAQIHAGAAKAGIDNMMRNLALEWGKHGIRSNSVVPGAIAGTEGVKRLLSEDQVEKFVGRVPLKRWGALADVGQLAVFLASPMASYITGTRLIVDGGLNLVGAAAESD